MHPEASKLSVHYLPVDALHPDPRNPKQHSHRQIKQLAQSIRRFGFNVPVLVDRSNRILAGHGRVLAAKLLGFTEVPVIRIETLSEPQARAFALADNRLAEAPWDDRLLGEIFSELAALELDFGLEDTGFSMAEIDLRIEGLSSAEPRPDPADEIPEFSDQPPVSAIGDVWDLGGRHRLLCGNALDAASYEVLMLGKRAQLVFADFPYNVPISGHVGGKGRIKHRELLGASGEKTSGQFIHFMATGMHLLVRYSVDGSLHFHCMDWRHAFEILTAGKQAYTELKNVCVWCKTAPGLGSLYRSQHEFVFVFKSGRAPHQNNIELGRHGRNRSNVWNYPSPSNFGRQGEEGALLALHPTVKAVALIADALLDASGRGDLVLDPMLGSGSTLIAAERVGRICYAMELDPLYVDTAIRRYQRYTGDAAIHAATGVPFDAIAAKRQVRHV
jgi:hypothetical protein